LRREQRMKAQAEAQELDEDFDRIITE
jgi:hypothetical protein